MRSSPLTAHPPSLLARTTCALLVRRAVFGKVIEGEEIVKSIEGTPTGPGDKPLEPVVVSTIEITED